MKSNHFKWVGIVLPLLLGLYAQAQDVPVWDATHSNFNTGDITNTSGKVGIGLSTTPTELLDVNGTFISHQTNGSSSGLGGYFNMANNAAFATPFYGAGVYYSDHLVPDEATSKIVTIGVLDSPYDGIIADMSYTDEPNSFHSSFIIRADETHMHRHIMDYTNPTPTFNWKDLVDMNDPYMRIGYQNSFSGAHNFIYFDNNTVGNANTGILLDATDDASHTSTCTLHPVNGFTVDGQATENYTGTAGYFRNVNNGNMAGYGLDGSGSYFVDNLTSPTLSLTNGIVDATAFGDGVENVISYEDANKHESIVLSENELHVNYHPQNGSTIDWKDHVSMDNTNMSVGFSDHNSGAYNEMVFDNSATNGIKATASDGTNSVSWDLIASSGFTVNGNTTINGSGYLSSGPWSYSDRRFKTNIQPVEDALSKITQLQGVYYDLRTEEFKKRNFPQGNQLGFIAQDVEKVVPQVVTTDKDGYKALAYQNLTALLVEGIKDQQKQLDDTKEQLKQKDGQIEELTNRLAKLEQSMGYNNSNGTPTGENTQQVTIDGSDMSSLTQNSPNPFGNTTTIAYNVASNSNNAFIQITDATNKVIKNILLKAGKGTLELNFNDFPSTMLIYTLYVNNQLIDSKKMVKQ